MNPQDVQRTATIAALSSQGKEISFVDWQEPVPLKNYTLPAFPVASMPDWQRDWVVAEARATQTPVELAALLVLGVTAVAGASKFKVIVREGWEEPLNLYIVIGLEPANRKSATFRDAVQPIVAYESHEAENLNGDLIESSTRRDILNRRLDKAKKDAAEAEPHDKSILELAAIRLAEELAQLPEIVVPRYITDDCSPEKLSTLLAHHQGRMGILSAEGDVFDLMAGKYSTKGMSNLGVFLKGHAGDTLRVDRIGRQSEFVESPAITLVLTVQPSLIRGLANRPDFSARGLIARILFSLPTSLLGHRDTNPDAVPPTIASKYQQRITELLSIPWSKDEQGDIQSNRLRLSKPAALVLDRFNKAVEIQLRPFGELSEMKDWAGKLVGSTARIAGNLHLAEYVRDAEKYEISENTIRRAIRISQYLIAHAKAAYAIMGTDQNTEHAEYILKWLKNKGVETITKRDLFQGTKGHFKTTALLEAPLGLLYEHGYIREREESVNPGKPGRKPSTILEINPWLHTHNSNNERNLNEKVNSEDSENSEDDIVRITSIPETTIRDPFLTTDLPSVYSLFPQNNQPHDHEYLKITNALGTHTRCRHCGEFPSKEGK